jgi:hypothetical protein
VRTAGAKDNDVLSQVLLEYVERVSGALALEEVQDAGPEGMKHLREIMARIQEELLGKMRGRLVDSAFMEKVRGEIQQRQDQNLDTYHKDWIVGQFLPDGGGRASPQAVLQAVEMAYPDPSQQGDILGLVFGAMEEQGLDPTPLQAALAQKSDVAPGEADPQKAPKGTLNRTMVLFLLREEINRAERYDYDFSAMLVTIRHAIALKPVPIGMIRQHEIRNALMLQLNSMLRKVDLVGCLEENKAMVILPFTGAEGVKVVKNRILATLDGQSLTVRNVPMRVSLVVAEEAFLKDRTADIRAFFKRLETRLLRGLKASR